MATNSDGTWEVVDGVQRISTVLHFVGKEDSLKLINKASPLVLKGLSKLDTFNDATFESLPKPTQLQFTTRPLRITTLNDKSDNSVRYDLFERLNTGGVKLHPQEIRNCVFRGVFLDLIKDQSENTNFRNVVKLPNNELKAAAYEECVLRFYAFRDRYRTFAHNVNTFLNNYTIDMNKKRTISDIDNFDEVMSFLRQELPNGVVRYKRKNVTPINLYEAVAVGTALAIKQTHNIKRGVLAKIIDDEALIKFTTGGTNSNPMVIGRIDYVKDRLL